MGEFLQSLSFLWVAPWRDSLSGMLWALWLGVLLAAGYAWYRRATLGRALSALFRFQADSPERARPAKDLFLTPAVVRALKKERMIRQEGELFYLPPEAEEKAQAISKVGNIALWQIPLVALGAYAVLVAAYYLIPLL